MRDTEVLELRKDYEPADLLAVMLEHYGLPEDAGLYRLLRHVYANRDLVFGVKDALIELLKGQLDPAYKPKTTGGDMTVYMIAEVGEGDYGKTSEVDVDYGYFTSEEKAQKWVRKASEDPQRRFDEAMEWYKERESSNQKLRDLASQAEIPLSAITLGYTFAPRRSDFGEYEVVPVPCSDEKV